MFDQKSRYYWLPTEVYEAPDGGRFVYKARRLPPPPSAVPALLTTHVRPDERLDLVAARTLGDATLFWRLCDANGIFNPLAEDREHAAALTVPRPELLSS